jgi:hypothetical protein
MSNNIEMKLSIMDLYALDRAVAREFNYKQKALIRRKTASSTGAMELADLRALSDRIKREILNWKETGTGYDPGR